jgi:hypothetical protein
VRVVIKAKDHHAQCRCFFLLGPPHLQLATPSPCDFSFASPPYSWPLSLKHIMG